MYPVCCRPAGMLYPHTTRLQSTSIRGIQPQAMLITFPRPDPDLPCLVCLPFYSVRKFAGACNIRHEYDKVQLPKGVVVLGDAYVALNPVRMMCLPAMCCTADLVANWLACRKELQPGGTSASLCAGGHQGISGGG